MRHHGPDPTPERGRGKVAEGERRRHVPPRDVMVPRLTPVPPQVTALKGTVRKTCQEVAVRVHPLYYRKAAAETARLAHTNMFIYL